MIGAPPPVTNSGDGCSPFALSARSEEGAAGSTASSGLDVWPQWLGTSSAGPSVSPVSGTPADASGLGVDDRPSKPLHELCLLIACMVWAELLV